MGDKIARRPSLFEFDQRLAGQGRFGERHWLRADALEAVVDRHDLVVSGLIGKFYFGYLR